MKRHVLCMIAMGLGLSGCMEAGIGALGIPPATVSPEDIANYEAAVHSIGCNLITEADYAPVEIQTGMSREQVLNITQFEISAGKAAPIEGGGVQLQTGACSPTNA